jgi:hypothetical protein
MSYRVQPVACCNLYVRITCLCTTRNPHIKFILMLLPQMFFYDPIIKIPSPIKDARPTSPPRQFSRSSPSSFTSLNFSKYLCLPSTIHTLSQISRSFFPSENSLLHQKSRLAATALSHNSRQTTQTMCNNSRYMYLLPARKTYFS